MITGLFDKNNKEIKIGDNYITHSRSEIIYTVYFKGGAVCGGTSFENAEPIGWIIDDFNYDESGEFDFELETDFSWIEIID